MLKNTVSIKKKGKEEKQTEKLTSFIGSKPIDTGKKQAFFDDINKSKNYKYKFSIGDKVSYNHEKLGIQNAIIEERYIDNGEARYIVYPPGKKNSIGYHIWVSENNLNSKKPKIDLNVKTKEKKKNLSKTEAISQCKMKIKKSL